MLGSKTICVPPNCARTDDGGVRRKATTAISAKRRAIAVPPWRASISVYSGNFGEWRAAAGIAALPVFCPIVQSSDAKPLARPSISMFGDQLMCLQNVCLRSRTDEGQSGLSERQIEEAPPGRRKVVVLALRYGERQHFDLPAGQTELAIEICGDGILRLGIGEQNLRRTRLENHVALRGVGDFNQTLG